MTTVTRPVHFAVKGKRKRIVRDPAPVRSDVGGGRVPRISKLMALAIRYDQLLKDGIVQNQTELAELAQVTQPRMTQIMNLLHLSPAIQEVILFLPADLKDCDTRTERDLRSLTSVQSWSIQQEIWESKSFAY